MDTVSALWTLARRGSLKHEEASLVQHGGRSDVEEAKQEGRDFGDPSAVATTVVAEKAAEPLLGRSLSPRERHEGSRIVHYVFGAVAGAVYGAAARESPR